ncbi:MAG: sulfite exporter TauE/SafE family protein [Phycisphaerales bacterium]
MIDLTEHPVAADLLIALGAAGAGGIGAMVGLGGGIVLVPLLTLVFGVDVQTAMGASLVAVIGTSAGAAAVRGRGELSNPRVAILLELAATVGAIGGALLMTLARDAWLFILFGVVLLVTALLSARHAEDPTPGELEPHALSASLGLDGHVATSAGTHRYHVQHPIGGMLTMLGAGGLSGLLGVGSGVFKVLAMDTLMRLPFRVSTVTSNFMVGLTAAASVGVYWNHGLIDPRVAAPSLIGIVPGAMVGAWFVHRVHVKILRVLFLLVLMVVAVQMVVRGVREEMGARAEPATPGAQKGSP